MKLAGTLLTPRKIAWVLLIAGIAYFIHISPKTPVEFFDAAMCDQGVVQRYKLEKYDAIDPIGAAATRKLEEIISCARRMERAALLYDIANNPRRVDAKRLDVVEGWYHADETTKAILQANDPNYLALVRQLDAYRKENNNAAKPIGQAVNGVRAKAVSDKAFKAAILKIAM